MNNVKLFENALKIELEKGKTKSNNLKQKIIIKLGSNLNLKTPRGTKQPRGWLKINHPNPKAVENKKKINLRRRNYVNEAAKNKLYLKMNKMILTKHYRKLTVKNPNPKGGGFIQPKNAFFYLIKKSRRLLFRHKPYNYKEKKRKPSAWIFRINRKLKKMNTNKKKKPQLIQRNLFAKKSKSQAVAAYKKLNLLHQIRIINQLQLNRKKLLLMTLEKSKKKEPQGGVKKEFTSNPKGGLWNPNGIVASTFFKQTINLFGTKKKQKVNLNPNQKGGGKKNNKPQRGWKKPTHKRNPQRKGFNSFYDKFGLRLNYKKKQFFQLLQIIKQISFLCV